MGLFSLKGKIDELEKKIQAVKGIDLTKVEEKIEGITEDKIHKIINDVVMVKIAELEAMLVEKVKEDIDLKPKNKTKKAE